MDIAKELIIDEGLAGRRLDKVLETLVPDSGLRLRRRLCDDGRVMVDGRPAKPGYKVRPGQCVEITGGSMAVSASELGLKVVAQDERFGAVFKPGGVHSANIEGRESASVESCLAELFPEHSPALLNRLDYLTSGLLLVALTSEAADDYQRLEDNGSIRKFYLAKVHGRLDGMVTVRKALDTDNRKTARVLDEDADDSRRWTDIEVLSHDHDAETTMVRCLIMKGARHQIRAHLASLDHPIVGDPLYGDGEGDVLYLHHERFEMDGFEVEVPSPWSS